MDIVKLAEQLGLKPRPAGKYFKMRCVNPEHQDSKPSLLLDRNKNTFKCLGCGEYGGIKKFYSLATGKTEQQAKQALQYQFKADISGQARPEHRGKTRETGQDSQIYQAFIKHLQSQRPEQRAVDYLHQERLLKDETIKQFNLCVLPGADTREYKQAREFLTETFKPEELIQAGILDGAGRVAFYQHRVITPVIQDFKLIGLQGRYFDKAGNTEPPEREGKYKNTRDFTGVLFNGDILRLAEPGDKVVLCEGALETILCYQEQRLKLRADIEETEPFVIGIFSITAWTEQNIKSLAGYDLILALHRDKDKNTGGEARHSRESRKKIQGIYYRLTGKVAEELNLPLGVDITEWRRQKNGKGSRAES